MCVFCRRLCALLIFTAGCLCVLQEALLVVLLLVCSSWVVLVVMVVVLGGMAKGQGEVNCCY
jgi:hypothetical protein